jgi:hypothetical protein
MVDLIVYLPIRRFPEENSCVTAEIFDVIHPGVTLAVVQKITNAVQCD